MIDFSSDFMPTSASSPDATPKTTGRLPLIVAACDPGVQGGIATWHQTTGLVNAVRIPHEIPMIELMMRQLQNGAKDLGAEVVWYQENMLRFAQRSLPASSIAMYAFSCGAMLGIAQSLDFKITLVWPQEWQKAIGTGTRSGRNNLQWKGHLKQMAQKFYPNITVTLATSDALLLLRYAVMRERGHTP